ncbi:NMT1/THI5 like protein [Rosistilla ulvae]|uniref:NMT1/THI5 like protein n=1 Tax=Rosistilla ulvae TaxID=1930277 RepID=A0A517M591_9BACT|nr:NMT1/THI5 like protein [Rosistilla ulvae]
MNRTLSPITAARSKSVSLVICIALLLSGCSSSSDSSAGGSTSEASGLQQVSLQLNWFPEAEHGGYYAADVHGYFADEGLEVTLLPGGPNVPVVQSVAAGRVAFAVTNADRVLFGHQAGAEVVALFAPIQNTPRCIMVHRESGISKLADLRDVTLAIGTGPAFFQYMQKHLPLTGVETIAYPGSIGPFLANKRFAQQAYIFSEPYVAKQQGADPVALMVSEIGYNPYASVLVASRKTLDTQSDLAQRIVRASARGWQKYLDDPVETNALIDSINPDMDAGALAFGAEQIRPLCDREDPAAPLGQMTAARWKTLIDQMVEIELVDADKVPAARVFDARFITPTAPQE